MSYRRSRLGLDRRRFDSLLARNTAWELQDHATRDAIAGVVDAMASRLEDNHARRDLKAPTDEQYDALVDAFNELGADDLDALTGHDGVVDTAGLEWLASRVFDSDPDLTPAGEFRSFDMAAQAAQQAIDEARMDDPETDLSDDPISLEDR